MLNHRHLHQAVKANQLAQFRFLVNTSEAAKDLKIEINPQWANELINYPLLNVASSAPKEATAEGLNALHLAARASYSHFIEGLARLGVDINARSVYKFSIGSVPADTALFMAVRNNDVAFTQSLLKMRANPNIPSHDESSTPLLFALENQLNEMARILLDDSLYNHDPVIISKALAFCLKTNDIEMASRLLFHKFNVNTMINGTPLLTFALPFEEMLQRLLATQAVDSATILAVFVAEVKANRENTASLLFNHLDLNALSQIPSAVIKLNRAWLPNLAEIKKAASILTEIEKRQSTPAELLRHLAKALNYNDSVLKIPHAQKITQKVITSLFKMLPSVEFSKVLESTFAKRGPHHNYILYCIASALEQQSQLALASPYLQQMNKLDLIEKTHTDLKKAVDELQSRIDASIQKQIQIQKQASFLLFSQSHAKAQSELVVSPTPTSSLSMVSQDN